MGDGGALSSQAEELAEMGSWRLDLDTRELSSSRGIRRLMNLRADDPDPTLEDYLQRVHPEDRDDVVKRWRSLVEDGHGFRAEHRLVLRGGQLRFMRAIAGVEVVDGLRVASGVTQDITELRLSGAEVERERDLSRTILSGLQDGYFLTHGGVILEVNDALCRITGFDRAELVGTRAPFPFWPPEAHQPLAARADETVATQGSQGHTTMVRKDGTPFEAALTATRVPNSELASQVWVVILRDITAEWATARLLQVQAQTDPLTGLLNSRAFRELLRVSTLQAGPLVLALLDLDHFKSVNDRFGHAVGDEVLVEAVNRLRSPLLPEHAFARVGGEEFAVLMPGLDLAGGTAVVEAALAALRAGPMDVVGTVTASAGLATLAVDLTDDGLYRLADRRLYAAKAAGRDRAVAG